MRCFELRDDTLNDGLLIDLEGGSPRVIVDYSVSSFVALAPEPAQEVLRCPEPWRDGLRLYRTDVTDEGLNTPKKNDRMALVRLHVNGGRGGLVTLTSGAYEDLLFEKEQRVEKGFRQFPPVGVNVVEEAETPDGLAPWIVGAERLELLIVMQHGSCFRVHRTGNLKGLLRDLFVEWHAYEGPKLRPSKKRGDNTTKEKATQRRETLLPALGLA